MAIHLPTSEAVHARLSTMSHSELQALAEQSGVPFTTLWKIRSGETKNTRLETLRKFWPLAERRREAR